MLTDECLNELCATVRNGSVDEALQAARALRNACAGNRQNAEYLVRSDIIQWIAMYCREIALMKANYSDEEANDSRSQISECTKDSDNKGKELLVLALCQFLSNFSACGEGPSQFLWSSLFGEHGEIISIIFVLVSRGSRNRHRPKRTFDAWRRKLNFTIG